MTSMFNWFGKELDHTRNRLEESILEKDNLASKCNSLESKLVGLQHELNKKERDSYNHVVAENTEKHLSNLCQTLTTQLEDLKLQLKLADEKCKRFECEQNSKHDKFEMQL